MKLEFHVEDHKRATESFFEPSAKRNIMGQNSFFQQNSSFHVSLLYGAAGRTVRLDQTQRTKVYQFNALPQQYLKLLYFLALAFTENGMNSGTHLICRCTSAFPHYQETYTHKTAAQSILLLSPAYSDLLLCTCHWIITLTANISNNKSQEEEGG